MGKNFLCNCGRGNYWEQFSEIILNLNQLFNFGISFGLNFVWLTPQPTATRLAKRKSILILTAPVVNPLVTGHSWSIEMVDWV